MSEVEIVRHRRRKRTTPPPDLYSKYYQGPDKYGKVRCMVWCNSCNEEVGMEILYVNCKCFRRQTWKKETSPPSLKTGCNSLKCQNSTEIRAKNWVHNFADSVSMDRLYLFLFEFMCFFIMSIILFEACKLFTGEPFAKLLNRMESNSSPQAPLSRHGIPFQNENDDMEWKMAV